MEGNSHYRPDSAAVGFLDRSATGGSEGNFLCDECKYHTDRSDLAELVETGSYPVCED